MAERLRSIEAPLRRIVQQAERAWKHPSLGWALWSICVLWGGYWWRITPSPGKAVALLAVAAAIMSMRDLKVIAKTSWILLVFGLLLLEVKAIDRDREVNEANEKAARKLEQEHFQTTVDGLKNVITESEQNFAVTLQSLERTIHLGQENINTITGGNSYMYFEPQLLGDRPIEIDSSFGPKKGDIIMNAYPRFVGEFPLQSVYVSTFANGWLPDIDYKTMYPHELGRPRQFLEVGFKASESKVMVNISINASNGSYYEAIILEKIKEHWVWDAHFGKYVGTRTKLIRSWSSPDFPKEHLITAWK